ncbi:hypothetical protein [Nocardioides sp. HB32]
MRQLLGVLLGGVGTAALYVACLGWNTPKDPGTCTGPYDAAQVVPLALGMVLLVVVASFLRAEVAAAAAATVEVTVLFAVDAITIDDPCAEGTIWPVGALLLLVGAGLGLGLVALLTSRVRRRAGPTTSN